MPQTVKFAKYQGLGNDFIILDDRGEKLKLTKKRIRHLCDRRLGIGCDQLIIARSSNKADFKMTLYNKDGSSAEMCGNGIRCLARFLYDRKITRKKELAFETGAGIVKTKIINGGVEVDMGEPLLGEKSGFSLKTVVGAFDITAVSMGNPHAVIFVKDVEAVPLERCGRAVETHNRFPKKTNVEFAQIITRKKIVLRVWERGAGATPACGTGACATLVAAVTNKLAGRKASILMPGGALEIRWDAKTNRVLMTGPAEESFTGVIRLT